MFYKIDVLKDFAKTQKTSVPESCFNKVVGLQKETPVQMFSSKYVFQKFLRTLIS